jgi:hypothetical protein
LKYLKKSLFNCCSKNDTIKEGTNYKLPQVQISQLESNSKLNNIDDAINSLNGKKSENKNKSPSASPFKRSITKKFH